MQRRRFIKILAAGIAGLNLARLGSLASPAPARGLEAVRWQGYTLGAEGSFTLYTDNRDAAQNILKHCFAEIRRLESLFSLYDHRSELCRLNREGRLRAPTADWERLLRAVDTAHALTDGHFDPTIQPLWTVYDEHFKARPEATTGPEPQALETARARTGWKHVHYDTKEIRFNRPGMQFTLNGIAQGYITDRVTEILQAAGYRHVLVELGETRALGPHPEGHPWRIGIKDANRPDSLHDIVDLEDRALATSGSYGSPFSKNGHYHHLIDPKSAQPAVRWKSLSVIAPTATEADALSTGLSFASAANIAHLEKQHPKLHILKQGT